MIWGYPYFWKHPIGSFAHLLQVCVTYTFLTGHESKGWDAPIRYEWRNRSTGAHWNDHNVFEVGRSILEMKFLMRVQEKQQSPVLCEYWTSKWLTKHIQDLDFFGDWGQLSPRYTSYLHVKNSLLLLRRWRGIHHQQGEKSNCVVRLACLLLFWQCTPLA